MSLTEDARFTPSVRTVRGLGVQNAAQNLMSQVSKLRQTIRRALEGTPECEMFDFCCEAIEENIYVKVFLIAVILNVVLPTFAFFVFTIVTFITTFIGFLLLEGAILFFAVCTGIFFFGAMGIILSLGVILATLAYVLDRLAGGLAIKIESYYFFQSTEGSDDENVDDIIVIDTDYED